MGVEMTEQTMTDVQSRVTKFYLQNYSSECNNYDRSKLFKSNHVLTVIYEDGKERSLDIGQLSIFLKYAAQHKNMGEALDAVYISDPP